MPILRPLWYLILGFVCVGLAVGIIKGLWDGSIWDSRRAITTVFCALPITALGGLFLLWLSFRQFHGKDLDIGGSD